MNFNAFREQAFPSTLATAGQSRAAAFRFHAGAKSVLALTGALGRLISAFHGEKIGRPGRQRAAKLGPRSILSMRRMAFRFATVARLWDNA
jgi:hypothetical protein